MPELLYRDEAYAIIGGPGGRRQTTLTSSTTYEPRGYDWDSS